MDYFLSEANKILREDLGLKNTYYANPHGLSNNLNKTSCFDMAIVSINMLKNKVNQLINLQLDYKCRSRVDGIKASENMQADIYGTRRYYWPKGYFEKMDKELYKTHEKIKK